MRPLPNRLVFVVALGLALGTPGCGDEPPRPSALPPAAVRPARPARTALTDAELQELRAGVARAREGMTRSQTFEALGVSLDGLAQIGTGPTTQATTIYVLGHAVDLNLTWDATDPDHPILRRAELVARGP